MAGWNEEIKKELGGCGEQVYIGHNVIFTNPSEVFLGNKVRIDPFTLVTTALTTGDHCHICAGAVLSGGKAHKITMGNWCFIGYGSKLFCASEDYSGDYGPVMECWNKQNKIFRGNMIFNNYSGLASDVMLMPGAILPEGCLVGAKTFVYSTKNFTPWSVWYGSPPVLQKHRNKDKVIEVAQQCE